MRAVFGFMGKPEQGSFANTPIPQHPNTIL